jgi:hypothetical protein
MDILETSKLSHFYFFSREYMVFCIENVHARNVSISLTTFRNIPRFSTTLKLDLQILENIELPVAQALM